tara:strand:+ start:370 stop:1059 length:690 start_codon:yes stop_codon:yes gene_type:complete
MREKRNIHALIEKEAPSLNNLLDPKDVSAFKELTDELRDTWTKKQVFRTETEMRFSVLNDYKYPTKGAKYWQAVREQNVYLENLMTMSFDYRKENIEIKKLEKKLAEEKDELEKELIQVEIDEKNFHKASMELTAKDRMREIKLWSQIKKEVDDGSFDKNDVNLHQLESYHKIMINRKNTLSAASTQPEIFNVLGQLDGIEKEKQRQQQLGTEKKEAIASTSGLGAKPE